MNHREFMSVEAFVLVARLLSGANFFRAIQCAKSPDASFGL